MKHLATFVSTLCLAAGAQAGCYTVLGPDGKILSESPNAPVDMSYQLHQTVPYKYGRGAVMVFGVADASCGQEVQRDDALGVAPATEPLRDVTQRRTRAPRRDRT